MKIKATRTTTLVEVVKEEITIDTDNPMRGKPMSQGAVEIECSVETFEQIENIPFKDK